MYEQIPMSTHNPRVKEGHRSHYGLSPEKRASQNEREKVNSTQS